VILLQVDPAFGDEPETVCEGCYETEDTSIFAWSLVPDVGHYRWLRGPIRRLLPNSKVDYLVRTIWRILDFLLL
jgi:GTPase